MKNALRRTLSLMLTVVMLVSCWMFTAPKSDAATAGNYYWKFRAYHASSNRGMTHDSKTITLTYKKNNGTGDTATTSFNLGSNWCDPDAGKNKDYDGGAISGFPIRVGLSVLGNKNYNFDAHIDFYLYVSSDNSNWHEVAHSYQEIGTTDWRGRVRYYASDLVVGSDKYPAAKTADSFSVTNKEIPTSGSTTTTVSIGTVRDQYGVSWYQDGNGVSYTAPTGVSGTGTTITISSSAMLTASPWYKDITLTAKCGSTTLTNTCTLRITNPKYTVTWHWHTNLDASTTWSGSTTTSNVYYNDTPSIPSGATGKTAYYDTSQHHSGGSYTTSKVTNTNKDFYMSYSINQNHSYVYSELPNTNANYHTKHHATCNINGTKCGYEKDVDHTYGTTSFGFSADGKTCTTSHTCTTSGCGHAQTGSATVTSAQQIAPTCTTMGTTRYTATSPWNSADKDTKDVQDIPTVSTNHNFVPNVILDGDANLASAANCLSNATYYKTCSYNSAHLDSETWENANTALGHHFANSWEELGSASETYKGNTYDEDTYHKRSCDREGCTADNVQDKNGSWQTQYAQHTYGTTVFTFSEDGTTATASRQCSVCNHTQSAAATVTPTVKEGNEATCTYKGITTYIAVSPFTGDSATDSIDKIDIPALGHSYGEWETVIPATCVATGVKECVCPNCSASTTGHTKTETIPIDLVNGHSMQRVDFEPQNGTDNIGLVYFQCANCKLLQGAEYNQTEEKYEPVGELVSELSEIEEENTQIVPTTVFNEYAENNMDFEHDYASRGGSLKIAAPYEYTDANTIQGMRFTASLFVPEGVALNCSVSDNYIVDFGFLWSQVPVLENQGMTVSDLRFNESTEETELPENVYKMSVVKNNKGVDATDGTNDNFTGDNWTGVSAHEDLLTARGTALTFNILINVKARNWQKDYCVRPYIKYKYNGTIYTIYDDGDGFDTEYSRNVAYVAQEVYDSPIETPKAQQYCETKILNNLKYIPEP